MGLKDITIALVTIGLFTIAILGFAINFAVDNDAPIDISDDSELSNLNTEVTGNVESMESDAEGTYQSIVGSSIEEGETTVKGGQFAITPENTLGVTKNIMRTSYRKIFGSDSGFNIFLTSFIGLLLFIVALAIWKAWIGRNPD